MEPRIHPALISAAEWASTVPLIISLWAFAGTMVLFAFSLMLAHAVVPSLVWTGHLPAQAVSYRPLLYALAALFLVIALSLFANIVFNLLQPIYGIYPKVWI